MLRIGQRVKLNPEIERFYYGRGYANYDDIGIIRGIFSNKIEIDFPTHHGWNGKEEELIVVDDIPMEEKIYCRDCGELISREDKENCYYEVIDGEYLHTECFEESYFYCADCGRLEEKDSGYYIDSEDKMVCQDCFDSDYFYCEECNCIERTYNRYSINNGYGDYTDICGNCFDNGCYYCCDDCGDYFESDDIREIHGNFYCEDCASSHEDETYLYDYHEFSSWELFKGSKEEKVPYYIGKEIELEPHGCSNETGVLEAINEFINAVGMHDGSLDCGGVEVVTHPESWEYLKEHKEDYIKFFDRIKELDYGDDGNCGLHFHVSRPSDEVIARIIVLLESFKDEIKKLSRRKGDFHWSKFMSDNCSCETEKVKYQSTKWVKDKYCNSYHDRYLALNLNNSNTIEFRFFNGANDFEEFWGDMQFIHNLMEVALDEKKEINMINWNDLIYGDELVEQAKKWGVFNVDKFAKDTTEIIEKYEIAMQKAKEDIRDTLRKLAKYINKEMSELDIKEVRTNNIGQMSDKLDEFMNKFRYRHQYLQKVTSLYNALNSENNSLDITEIKDYWNNTKASYPVNTDRYKRYNKMIEKAIKKYESEVR